MKPYKSLRKKLKNKFDNPYDVNNQYNVVDAIYEWVNQCGIKCTEKHYRILILINNNTIFYPYQKKDRKRILKGLKHGRKSDVKKTRKRWKKQVEKDKAHTERLNSQKAVNRMGI